jgi:hypothetical protein
MRHGRGLEQTAEHELALELSLRKRAAALANYPIDELRLALLQQLGGAAHHLGALARTARRPCRLRVGRCGEGRVDVRGVGEADLAQ